MAVILKSSAAVLHWPFYCWGLFPNLESALQYADRCFFIAEQQYVWWRWSPERFVATGEEGLAFDVEAPIDLKRPTLQHPYNILN